MSSEPAAVPRFSWRRPQSFLEVATAAATSPRQFFAALPGQASYTAPLGFFLAAMLVPSLVRALAIWSQGPKAMATFFGSSLLMSMVLLLVFSFVLYCVCRFVLHSKLELPDVVAIVCYSSGVRVLEFLPQFLSPMTQSLLLLGMVFFICYLIWVGLQAAGGLRPMPALLALVLAMVLIVALWLLIKILRDLGGMPAPPPAGAPPTATPPARP